MLSLYSTVLCFSMEKWRNIKISNLFSNKYCDKCIFVLPIYVTFIDDCTVLLILLFTLASNVHWAGSFMAYIIVFGSCIAYILVFGSCITYIFVFGSFIAYILVFGSCITYFFVFDSFIAYIFVFGSFIAYLYIY